MKTRVLSVFLVAVLLTAALAFSANAALPAGYSQADPATWGTCPCCETPCSQITWTPLSAITSTNRSLGTGHYYLTQDVACATFMYPKSGNTITINLNGYTLSRSNARPILMTSNVVLNLWNGNLETNRATENGNAIGPDGASSGYKVNLYNTNVTHTGTATGGYGLIYMNGGELNLHGTSTISGGRSTAGGNVYLNNATMNMYDTSCVSGGKAGDAAGNIYLVESELNMNNNSSVINGESAYTGGNVRGNGASAINMYDDSAISGGKSKLRGGGNIYFEGTGGSLYMEDYAAISGGEAMPLATGANYQYGGNVYINATAASGEKYGATVTMNGNATITGGESNANGGSINLVAASMEMNDDSEVHGGTALNGSGGALYLSNSALEMNNSAIVQGGKSGYTGGNIRTTGTSAIAMNGGTVSGGESTLRGSGNIHLDVNCTLEMAGTAKLTGGTAASGYTGANIAVAASATATMNGGTMEGTGDAVVVQGTLNVDGSAKVTATITGKLVVKKNFAGNVTIARDDAVWGYSIPDIGNDVALPTARAEAETGYVNAGTIRYANKQTDIRSYADDTKLYYSVADMGGATWNAQYKTITMFYETGAAAIANSVAPNVAILYNDMDKATVSAGNTRIVDLNGHTVAELTNNGTLSLVDSANDTMDADACGEVTKLTNNGTLQQDVTWNSKRYVTILEDNGIASAHRLELRLSYVTFRPAAFGFYYKATFNADDVLADKITGYGVALSLNSVPDASVRTKTEMTDFAAARGSNVKFGGLYGIMKESNGAQVNAENGMTKVYANCYVKVGDLVILADNENVGKKAGDAGFTGIGKSLLDVMNSLNEKTDMDAAQLAAVEQFKQELTKMGVAWPEAGATTLTTIPTAA